MKKLIWTKAAALAMAGCGGSPRAAGTAKLLSRFSTYYVRADGSDSNDGLSEAASFKTLRKAMDAAIKGRIPVITVLGVLNLESEGISPLDSDSVFVITNTHGTELTIRGKEGADEAEQGIFSGTGAGKVVITVWEESRVRFEFLRIEGGFSEYTGAGINVRGQTQVTLGEGTLVRNNHSRSGGVAIDAPTGGKFIKSGGTIDATNRAGIGIVGYVFLDGNIYQKRDSAAEPDVNLDSGKSGGAGGWE